LRKLVKQKKPNTKIVNTFIFIFWNICIEKMFKVCTLSHQLQDTKIKSVEVPRRIFEVSKAKIIRH
jgi:hypothetical protein